MEYRAPNPPRGRNDSRFHFVMENSGSDDVLMVPGACRWTETQRSHFEILLFVVLMFSLSTGFSLSEYILSQHCQLILARLQCHYLYTGRAERSSEVLRAL
jgi:hypothetical protein